jgi:hypothetical protein
MEGVLYDTVLPVLGPTGFCLWLLVLGFRDRLVVLHEADYNESVLLKIIIIDRFWCNKTTYLFTLVARVLNPVDLSNSFREK